MGRADYLKLGDSNGLCQQCGFKFKMSMLSLRWDGIYVCSECWEPRHPQDFVRGIKDIQTPPVVSPEPEDQFTGLCTTEGLSCIAGYMVAGCTTAGVDHI